MTISNLPQFFTYMPFLYLIFFYWHKIHLMSLSFFLLPSHQISKFLLRTFLLWDTWKESSVTKKVSVYVKDFTWDNNYSRLRMFHEDISPYYNSDLGILKSYISFESKTKMSRLCHLIVFFENRKTHSNSYSELSGFRVKKE